MNANDSNSRELQADVIELGVASTVTLGGGAVGEPNGDPIEADISEE
ncbi:hypothetical protein [Luteimonas sp. TWI1416]